MDTSLVDEGYTKKPIEYEANLNVVEKLILDTNNNPYVKLKRINVEKFFVEENVDSPEDDDDDSDGSATGSGSGKRYPMSFKIEVGKFMANHTETEASKKFGIPRATAWRWKKFKSRLDIKVSHSELGLMSYHFLILQNLYFIFFELPKRNW